MIFLVSGLVHATLSFSKNNFTFCFRSDSFVSTKTGLDRFIPSSLLNAEFTFSPAALLLFCREAFSFLLEVGVMCSHITFEMREGEDEEDEGGGVVNGVDSALATNFLLCFWSADFTISEGVFFFDFLDRRDLCCLSFAFLRFNNCSASVKGC